MSYKTRRERLQSLVQQLTLERATFLSHWRDLGDFVFPRRGRFMVSDVNKGDRRNHNIVDSTATLAARTLRSGMMAGVTSPARPWYRLTTPDPELAEFGAVKEWLEIVTQRMRAVHLRCNLYNSLPIVYGDMGVFATAAMSAEEDFEDAMRTFVFPIGSYMIANNASLRVNVFAREFRMTVRQLVERFGKKNERTGEPDWSNFSEHVRRAYDESNYEQWIDVCSVIEPNDEHDPKSALAKHKKFRSTYYERGYSNGNTYDAGSGSNERFLSEKGFDLFPVLAPRWEVTGEDIYGTDCPAMTALGDNKQLQKGERRGMQAVDKMVNPPMVAPNRLRTQKTSILPGDVTYVDIREGELGFRPAHEVNPQIDKLEMKQAQVRQRIQRAFYEDLFLMLAQSDRREITAREIEERHEEKLLALGPVLEQLNQDLLDPLIDLSFDIMNRQGLIPPAPEELRGMRLKVEYISIMAQAQKTIGLAGIERFAGFGGQLLAATQNPEVLDKYNFDQIVDEHAEATGVSARCVRTDEEVAEIRQRRAQAQQAAQAAEVAKASAGAVRDLASADMSGDNMLTRLAKVAQAGQIAAT